ncbi:MAG TPA: glycosyltransferase family 2 protein [Bryobacteraceae bacterium]|jgi:GT2 family glycosyltransferase|nr:glycosyltransferase family 2 protein [Bryobacteraceae bacterium]
MLKSGSVAVTIVTYNSGSYIRRCLDSVLDQKYPNQEVIVIDNASTDGTPDILEGFEDRVRVIYNEENAGFAAAQNQAIGATKTDWVLVLNPDVLLMPGFIPAMVTAGEAADEVGSVCGKLLTMSAKFELPDRPLIDSTGIYFTPALRHFDRGSQTVDDGSYEEFEYVFGATGAAALYRRKMIEDIAIDGEFFDADFFVYREDADVAWRAQLLGWKCLYVPHALGYHVRSVLPGNRRALPPLINMHSVKNRCLLRIKNITKEVYLRNWLPISLRDAVVVVACLVREFTSLKAFGLVAANFSKFRLKRHEIMRRRRASDAYIAAWFSFSPVSFPAPHIAAKTRHPVRALYR